MVHRYADGGYELLETWELGGDHREDVPVVLLHYRKHQQRFLLEGGPKLEKTKNFHPINEREMRRERERERESKREGEPERAGGGRKRIT